MWNRFVGISICPEAWDFITFTIISAFRKISVHGSTEWSKGKRGGYLHPEHSIWKPSRSCNIPKLECKHTNEHLCKPTEHISGTTHGKKTPNKPKPKPQTISFCRSWCGSRARAGRIRWAIHTLKWLRTILMWIRGQADLLWFSVKVKRLKYKELLKCDSIKGVGTAGTESECQRERVHLQSSLNELKDVNLKNLLKY